MQALGLQLQGCSQPPLQTLLSDQSPDAVEGPRGLLTLGLHLLGGRISQQMGHRSCTQKRGSLPMFSHLFLHKKPTGPWEAAPSPALAHLTLAAQAGLGLRR